MSGATTPTETPPKTETPPAEGEGETLLSKGKEEAKKEEPKGPPNKYADYKVPEGYTLDPEVRTKAEGLFKKSGLTQDLAQEFVDFYIAETKEAFEAPFKAYNDMKAKWREESMNHPELRGKLAKDGDVQTRIGRALAQMNDPALESEFRQMMDLTAAGNHQAFIRVFYNLAKQVTEGSHVAGRGPSATGQSESGRVTQPSAAQALYPTLPSNSR